MARTSDLRERRIAAVAALVARPGEFIHLDRRTPRLASGEVIPRATLRELQKRNVVEIVNADLLGEPMQFAAPGAVREPEAVALDLVGVDFKPNARRRPGHWTRGNRAAAKAMFLAGGVTKAEIARRFKTSRGFIVRMAKLDRWSDAV